MTQVDTPHSARARAVSELVLEVFRLNGRLLGAGDALVADVGLTSARWQVIGAVAMSASPLPVSHIARDMGLTRQSVQRLVNELEKGGLVRFAPNPRHERAKLVLLTENGAKSYRDAMDRQEPWAETLASDLDANSIEAARALLRELRRRLETAEREKGESRK